MVIIVFIVYLMYLSLYPPSFTSISPSVTYRNLPISDHNLCGFAGYRRRCCIVGWSQKSVWRTWRGPWSCPQRGRESPALPATPATTTATTPPVCPAHLEPTQTAPPVNLPTQAHIPEEKSNEHLINDNESIVAAIHSTEWWILLHLDFLLHSWSVSATPSAHRMFWSFSITCCKESTQLHNLHLKRRFLFKHDVLSWRKMSLRVCVCVSSLHWVPCRYRARVGLWIQMVECAAFQHEDFVFQRGKLQMWRHERWEQLQPWHRGRKEMCPLWTRYINI